MRKRNHILLILAILLLPAWCSAGVNVDWYDSTETTTNYLFSWDAETVTAKVSGGGTITASVNSEATLSTTYSVSPTHSVYAPTGYDYYKFIGGNLFNSSKGVIDLYVYGNASEIGSGIRILRFLSSGSDNLEMYHDSAGNANSIRVLFTFTSGSVYASSSAESMVASAWNHVVFSYDNTTGVTMWNYIINGVDSGNGTDADTWNPESVPSEIRLGVTTSSVPTIPVYLDDVQIR